MEPFHSRESETNSVTNGHLIQRREGVTNQVNVLDSRLLQNVKKSSIQNTLLGKLRPTKMLEAEIYSSALSWNSDGSLLMAGGDRTLRIWTYPEGNLIHTLSTGLHSKGIHSAKFIKEYPQRVVSGTQKVQLWDINSNVEFASFNCHNNRVAGVLVVEGSPDVIWSAGIEGNVRAHDLREVCECEQGTQQGSQQGSQCKKVVSGEKGN
ncbi:WD repeat domain-containing protein [Trifolium repens]|nr:WD repeat domain-containing protein [Trifolium repens]